MTDVQYVELHGTGSPLGDKVEAAALGSVFGAARTAEQPLAVGSVKTNVGHLEAAAGIVGLVKAALSIEHGELGPSLNFERPNPETPLDGARPPDSGDGGAVAGRSPSRRGRERVRDRWDELPRGGRGAASPPSTSSRPTPQGPI